MKRKEKKMDNRDGAEIFEYIRRRRHGKVVKVGVVLGLIDEGVIKIGWSKCNIKSDTFKPLQGIELAKARARNETPTTTPVPNCIKRQMRQFCSRAVRYFKGAQRLEIPA